MTYIKTITSFFVSFLRPHPARDWFYMFLILATLLLCFVIFGAYMFIGIRSGWISGDAVEEQITVPQISRNDLNTVVESYRNRLLNFNSRNFPLPTLFDPSK